MILLRYNITKQIYLQELCNGRFVEKQSKRSGRRKIGEDGLCFRCPEQNEREQKSVSLRSS